jgi:tetratricopeptide (TPR) repeat protein
VAILEAVGESPPMVKIDPHAARLRHARYYAKVVNCQFEHYRNGQNREGMVLFEQERAQTDLAWEWAMRQQQSLSSEFNIMVQNFANAATWAGRSGVLRHPEVKQSIIAHHTRWLATARKIGDRRQEGNALENLGAIYHSMGEVQQAIDYYEQCLQMFRDMGDGVVVARNSWNLGTLYESQGDLMKAVPLMQVYVDWLQQIGHTVAEEHAQILDQVKSKLADQGG